MLQQASAGDLRLQKTISRGIHRPERPLFEPLAILLYTLLLRIVFVRVSAHVQATTSNIHRPRFRFYHALKSFGLFCLSYALVAG